MSDLLRKQILRERNKLTDITNSVNEDWVIELIGASAVREIKADAERRADAELFRSGIFVPPCPHYPQTNALGLSSAAQAYWTLVEEARSAEPPLNWYKPVAIMRRLTKVKLRVPKQIKLIAGHMVFTPKLNKRDEFIAGLHRVVDAYERLPRSEQSKFTTDGAPEIGGLRFPRPVAFAEADKARIAYQKAASDADAVRAKVTRQAWLDGLDRAVCRNTGSYKIGGRLGVEKEGSDEQGS